MKKVYCYYIIQSMDSQIQRHSQFEINCMPEQKFQKIAKTCDSQEKQSSYKIFQSQKLNKGEKKTRRWSLKQNKIYLKFLQDHGNLLRYQSVRRVRQIFALLSERMQGLRTASQCKSHHQKMKKATEKGTVREIIDHIKRKNELQLLKLESSSKWHVGQNKTQAQSSVSYRKMNTHIMVNVLLSFDCIGVW